MWDSEGSPFTEISAFVNKNKVSPFWGKCKVDQTHTTWAYHNTFGKKRKELKSHVGYDSKWIQDHHHSLADTITLKGVGTLIPLLKTHLAFNSNREHLRICYWLTLEACSAACKSVVAAFIPEVGSAIDWATPDPASETHVASCASPRSTSDDLMKTQVGVCC